VEQKEKGQLRMRGGKNFHLTRNPYIESSHNQSRCAICARFLFRRILRHPTEASKSFLSENLQFPFDISVRSARMHERSAKLNRLATVCAAAAAALFAFFIFAACLLVALCLYDEETRDERERTIKYIATI
jgi:hypothetical protein